MAKSMDWESRIGRRIHLRDLHIFFAVSQRGSMAKAAAQLGITQPIVPVEQSPVVAPTPATMPTAAP